MEKKPLISIIVPVYNVEQWLERCLDSILSQTYTQWEATLVDDGSTDSSGEICDKYSLRDARIQVIHKPNGGLSSARNAGLAVARGEYVGFVDSDDYIDKNMYMDMMNMLCHQSADLAVCSLLDEYSDGKIEVRKITEADCVKDNLEGVRQFLLYDSGSVCNKLIKRILLPTDNIFPLDVISEDIPVSYMLAKQSQRTVFMEKGYYHYCHENNTSITAQPFSKKMMPMIDIPCDILADIKIKYPQFLEEAKSRYMLSLMNVYEGMRITPKSMRDKSLYKIIKKRVMRDIHMAYTNPYLPDSKKRYAFLIRLHIEQLAKKLIG